VKKPVPFGKYFLLERINVGGMAEVFRAKAYGVEGFERLVAVKRILPNIAEDKEFIKMFIDEAKIAVQLNHANVAQIFDLGMVEQSYYIALEHIHGRDLRAIFDRCRNQGEPMPVAQACFVVMKTCEGLDYAHNKRDSAGREVDLVHRDVSPQNVLVSFEGEVKIIDFGIAKAAGKGSKTQAGILKGKFGYMSPEQVRGLPIDRRSDIFSCGIVLYELLTGERLFVGESDFSTLEKVRNVEILPPSTYNRKIPDELERIVLKALAKDVEDRYQNAIDLHDELQAFVYTAGEFYSRKDLASWMKRVFAREIEDESAKLESYRQLRPPEAHQSPQQRRAVKPTAPLKSTMAMPTVAPPPIPRSGNGAGNGHGHAKPSSMHAAAAGGGDGLEWDDDELETQIYDNLPEDEAPAHLGGPGAGMGAGLAAAAAEPEPDLSSLVQTAKGWESPPPPAATQPPQNIASGSSKSPSPFAEVAPAAAAMNAGVGPAYADTRDPSAVVRLVNMAEPIFQSGFDANPSYAPVAGTKSRTGLMVALLLGGLALIGGAVALVLILRGGDNKIETAAGGVTEPGPGSSSALPSASSAAAAAAQYPAEVLQETGFDLYIEPAAIKDQVTVKVDGKLFAIELPAHFRNLAPGDHTIEIEAPRPYRSKTETVTVAPGKAGPVTIRLDAEMVTVKFESTPPGAAVTLVAEGQRTPLGPAPVSAKLDPAKRYEVVFERDGYVGQTKPVEFTGRSEESLVALLARSQSVASSRPAAVTRRDPPRTKPDPPVEKPDPVEKPKPDPDPPKASGTGTLMIGAKPPCMIFIDGKNTGKKTPQRDLELSAGRHKITLVNNEFNIKETFTITIKANQPNKVMKDMMDRTK
jgi:serine/threonine protein kinase